MVPGLLKSFVNRFFRRASLESDLDAELQSHLAIEIRQRIERGESAQSAREMASREFGNKELIAEVTRDMWGFVAFEQLMQDARYAARTLRKSPLFTSTIAITLALGIGCTTAIFTLVHGILLRPLAFPSPERLAMIWELLPQTQKKNVVLLNNFVAWKERSRSFQSMAAFFELPMNLLNAEESEQVPGLKVTAEFFTALGTPPILGRAFRPGEYYRDEPREVILSYDTWQRRFGGSPDIIGKRISIDVSHHEVIGVMPPGFGFPNVKADLYVPLAIDLNDGRNYSVVARLKDGASIGAAGRPLWSSKNKAECDRGPRGTAHGSFGRRCKRRRDLRVPPKPGKPAADHVESRCEDQTEHRDADHAGKHRCAERLPKLGAGARCPHQRHDAEDEGERGHQDRAQA